MRLTLINQFYRPDVSPTAHLTASLAEHRAALGDRVTVVTSRGGYVAPAAGATSDPLEPRHTGPDVRRVWTPQLGKRRILTRLLDYASYYLLATWHVLRLPAQDVIIALTTPPYIAWAAVLHKLLHRGRTRVVLWNMDCYPDVVERAGIIRRGGLLSRALRRLNRMLFRRIDHLVCLDTAMVELLCSQYAPGPGRPAVTIIPNWEDAAFFPADARPPRWDGAAELGLAGNFVVLYLGNTGVGHAFETALDAAALLRAGAGDDEDGSHVRFLFVGGGSRWASIRDEVARRGLDNVILRNYVPKELTPSVMAAADCALITLRDDALGVMSPSKLHANLAMGLPVAYVGPRGSNVDDAIARFGCGASLRHGDAQGLADYLRLLMSEPSARAAARAAARRAFDQAYCDRRTLPQFDRVLESLTAGEPLAAARPQRAAPATATQA
jgi:glycosyltransferase involved in cell wall biosynthesis